MCIEKYCIALKNIALHCNIYLNMEKNYYTPEDLAKIFCVSYRTILNWIYAGGIRAFKVGPGLKSSYRIPKSEVLRIEIEGIKKFNQKLKEEEKE